MASKNRLLYHGTERPKEVLREGLDPDAPGSREGGGGKEGHVHLTTSWRMAIVFGTPLVVQVPDPERLDADELASMDAEVYDEFETSFVYPGFIPPERIAIVPRDADRNWYTE
jgi:hypothetical protein